MDETDLTDAIQCSKCRGSGENPDRDWWNECGCGDKDCIDCQQMDWDDEPDFCPECGGSGIRENEKKCLSRFLAGWEDALTAKEREIVRLFLMDRIAEGKLTNFDVCELIDIHGLSK